MQELSPNQRTPEMIDQLVNVWEKSVSATHLFLSKAEIAQIKTYVPQALKMVPLLIIETNEQQEPIAFMGISEKNWKCYSLHRINEARVLAGNCLNMVLRIIMLRN